MSNIFTLDSMREEIEREFAPFQVEMPGGKLLTLRNILRVPKKNRETVYEYLDQISEAQKDEEDSLGSTEKSAQIALQILPLVADNEKLGRQLVEQIEDDLALTLRVFSKWMEGTQVGEAAPSQS